MSQTLTEIKALLTEAGQRPKKRLGQNFLHDGNQMEKVLAAAEVREGDRVLEVGAGTGALTERLLDAGAQVVAVEIDRDLGPILRQRLEPYDEQVTLIIADVLESKHRINKVIARQIRGRPFKLVANLPYQIASPLLVNLAAEYPNVSRAVVMIQKEVAARLTASPGNKTYGPLTVMIQALCEVEQAATLPPSCFWPQPKVESAIVTLRRREQPLTDDPTRLATLVHTLFSQRRKQLKTTLGGDVDWPADVNPKARPETLSVPQLIELSRVVSQKTKRVQPGRTSG